jgi:L-lactate dehydrogenase complex protein LldG
MEKQSSRETILQAIRMRKTAFSDEIGDTFSAQSAAVSSVSTEELREQFKQNLKAAGGNLIEVKEEEVDALLASSLKGALDFNLPEVRAEYPADCPLEKLAPIERLILHGRFGVAENGAIWIEDSDFPHRLLPFITQQLILRLDAGNIVSTMQDAYHSIDLKDTGFGVFISGPSKTADIEQSLVYGAHGAKELTVLLVSIAKKTFRST